MSEAFERAQAAHEQSLQIQKSLQRMRLWLRIWFLILVGSTFFLSVRFHISNIPLGLLLLVFLVGQIVSQVLLIRLVRNHNQLALDISEIFLAEKAKSPQTCGSMDPHLTQAR